MIISSLRFVASTRCHSAGGQGCSHDAWSLDVHEGSGSRIDRSGRIATPLGLRLVPLVPTLLPCTLEPHKLAFATLASGRESEVIEMRRRDLLKMTALAPCAPLIRKVRAALPRTSALKTLRRVRPSDPAWPDAEQWAQLRERVGGELIAAHQMFAGCGSGP